MAAPVLKTADISLPVLQRTTSSRVTAALSQEVRPPPDDEALPAPPPELLEYDPQDRQALEEQEWQMQNHQQPPPPDSPLDSLQPPPLPDPPLDSLQPLPPPDPHLDPNQQRLGHQDGEKLQHAQEEAAVDRLQSKYASPGNLLPSNLNNSTGGGVGQEEVKDVAEAVETHVTIADHKENGLHSVVVKEKRGTGSVSAFSDTSSDVSDVPATSAGPGVFTTQSAPLPAALAEGATESDLQQVDMFYRSQQTDVRVCQSLANMYLSATKTMDRMPAGQANGESPLRSPDPTAMTMEDWDFIKTGIPVLVLNTGQHVRRQKLTIVLAEKGTGFSLWEDELTASTRYDSPHANFHTVSLSTDPSRLVGFSFDEAKAAAHFAEAVRELLPRPDEDDKDKKKKKKKKEKKPKYKPPKKIDISQPCCFVHVTKLERPNISLFPSPPSGAELSQAMMRSRSQSSELSEYSTSPSEN